MKAPLFAFPLWIAATAITGTVQAATTGNLTFRGDIQGGTCNLATSDVNRIITLPTVKVSDFDNTDWTGLTEFNLTANCDSDIRNVTFTFGGTPSPTAPTRFANTGTAGGIATVIQSRIGGVAYSFPANGNATARSRTIPASAGQAVLPMGAHYIKISAVSKGSLLTTASVTITYN
ncbi:fimbrial protein [Pseudomonas gingeri]|uniref:Type 1 fimbrial protein n=1 Tax=Pseudomonas gingeri TaxID=117681 RepID=A0A7Y7YE41_9PSED|nr:fimbrial protein [Pseudomonas gingeri]NWB28277.1 type 1 fimbrial protein [Pseudomonas gingeri]NWC34796.1 type 1 fimbrial protein [Pseudomonas gingeri]NWD05438.1 type 1 fimbrial protein [Pseudomonas gingeri]NWD49857.1 type 1 fimbrial protein [Pseudomonas gingeri]NWE30553.1 type 1 fimbrial protein [Pseudomonas gingeri]